MDRIDGIIRFFLYLLIAVLPFSKAGVEICFSISLSLWIIKLLLLKRFKPQGSILNGPIVVFIIIGIFSVIGSIYFELSLRAFFTKFMEGLLLYFIIIEVIKQKRHIAIIIGLLLSATVVVCIDGFIQAFLTGIDIFRQVPIVKGGITAAFNHRNDLGGYLLFPIPIVVTLILKRLYILKRKSQVAINIPILVTLIALLSVFINTILLTNSKGAWGALVLGLLYSYLLINKRIFMVILISGCLALAPFFLKASATVEERFQADTNDVPQSAFGRMQNWKEALGLAKDRPIFGYGINTYMRIMARRHISRRPIYAHNCFLQLAAEMGIIGLICFLWIIVRLFSRCILKVRRHKSEARFLLAGLLCGLLAFLLHSFVDTNLYSLQLNALFWYIVGLTVCVYNQLEKAGFPPR